MQTGITAEPLPLSYRLRVEDLVAYWVYLCCHAHRLVPPAVVHALTWPLAAPPAVAGALLIFPVVAFEGLGSEGTRAVVGVGLVSAGLFGSVLLVHLIKTRPDLFLDHSAPALVRWLCLARLGELARKQEGVRLDTISGWRFSMTAEGFTLLTEREEVWAGVVTVVGKRIQGAWAVLEHVGATNGHLFLTARDGTVFIVPRAAVPTTAFHDLVAAATRYHRAAVEVAPPANGIVLRVEQVQGATRPSEGVMRQEDRIVG